MDDLEEKLMLEYAKTNDKILQQLNSQVPNAAERRRYALLQAAMVFYSSRNGNLEASVTQAEMMLAEIERRET